MKYLIITYSLNVVWAYLVYRGAICTFINNFPSIHKFRYKELKLQALTFAVMQFFIPLPISVVLIAMFLACENICFRYYKPKIVMKYVNKKIDVGYVPKYLNPKHQNEFLYSFDVLEKYQYKPTARLTKALSGNFHKQKDTK